MVTWVGDKILYTYTLTSKFFFFFKVLYIPANLLLRFSYVPSEFSRLYIAFVY